MIKKNRRNVFIYISLICGVSIVYYLICIFSKGNFINAEFVNDANDSFMDYFNSINNAKIHPYKDGNSNYPALANLLFKFFFHVIPRNLRAGNGFDLRNVQMAVIVFCLYSIITLWFLMTIIRCKINLSEECKVMCSLAILISAPIMFTIERGNIILFSFALSCFYVFYHDSSNKFLKELSFLALAIAAGLKIYPAILGLMLVKKKRVAETIRLIIYGFLFFFVPFIYYGGWKSLKIMIDALFFTSAMPDELGWGVNVSLYSILQSFCGILGVALKDGIFYLLLLFVSLVFLLSFFFTKSKWMEQLSLVMLITLLPKTNYYYVCIFFIIPFAQFCDDWENGKLNTSKINKLFAIPFLIIFVPLPLGKVNVLSEGKKFFVSYSMLLDYFAIFSICVLTMMYLVDILLKHKSKMGKCINMVLGGGCYHFTEVYWFALLFDSKRGVAVIIKMMNCDSIKLFIIDVDGTMTDGGVYYDEHGNEIKKFCTKDAAGFFAAHAVGIKIMVLTGRECVALTKRMREMKVDYLCQNVKDKKEFLSHFMKEHGLQRAECAYIGDDLNDLPPMSLVGFVGCPADSCEEIIKIANYVSTVKGGYGAVRDVISYCLKQRGEWEKAINLVYEGNYEIIGK